MNYLVADGLLIKTSIMTLHFKRLNLIGFCIVGFLTTSNAQNEKVWTLDDCIQYAFSKNIQIQQAGLSEQQSQLYLNQAKAARLPSLSAGISNSFGWDNSQNTVTNESSNLKSSSSTSYSLSSSVQLFNGMKLNNQLKQANLDLLGNQFYSEQVRESVELNILDAYLQVLYAIENVTNSAKQVESTQEELDLAKERMDLGIISKSDYLQIKSQLASEKLTLVNAEGNVRLTKLTLMQLMELPVTDTFAISIPEMDNLLNPKEENLSSTNVYQQALSIKPQIKQAELNTQSAELDIKIAKAALMPSLSMSAGIGTNYLSTKDQTYFGQLGDGVSPSLGLSLSIPIYQKKQAKTSIGIAEIGVDQAQLSEIETKNELRKNVEQAIINVETAKQEFEASTEDYEVTLESFEVASEKFKQGMMNSVDFLYEKTNLIVSESSLLQSKYNLIFSNKVVDFYKGERIKL